MRRLLEYVLSKLFPIKPYKIETAEEATQWFQYEVSNHPDIDPFRPLGYRDSWAGKLKQKPQEKHANSRFDFPHNHRHYIGNWIWERSKADAARSKAAERNSTSVNCSRVRAGR